MFEYFIGFIILLVLIWLLPHEEPIWKRPFKEKK
jgi:hypothetical protein